MEPVPIGAAAAVPEESPVLKVSAKGNPPGIIDHRSGKKQARLPGIKVEGTAYHYQRPIPGLFKDVEEALAAQAVARQKFDAGGVDAVWPPKNDDRNQRGTVCCALHARLRLLLLTCSCVCAQGSKRAHQALEKAEARAAKKDAKTDERDPKLPTSVLLPKGVSEVNNVHVAALLAEGVRVAAEPAAGATASAAEPAPSPH